MRPRVTVVVCVVALALLACASAKKNELQSALAAEDTAKVVWEARMEKATEDPVTYAANEVERAQLQEAGKAYGDAEATREDVQRRLAVKKASADQLHIRVGKVKEAQSKSENKKHQSEQSNKAKEKKLQEQIHQIELTKSMHKHQLQSEDEQISARMRSSLDGFRRVSIQRIIAGHESEKLEEGVRAAQAEVDVAQQDVTNAEQVETARKEASAKVTALENDIGESSSNEPADLKQAKDEVLKLTVQTEALQPDNLRRVLGEAQNKLVQAAAKVKVSKKEDALRVKAEEQGKTEVAQQGDYSHQEAALQAALSGFQKARAVL